MVTPVFVISGLLDSGKTTLIKNMFRSPDFRNNGPTLLIMCEDGEEEFEREFSELKTNQIYHYATQAKSEDYLKTAKEEISKLDLDKLSNRLFSKANVILECEDIADFIVKKYEL